MSESAIGVSLPWYRSLSREQWRVLYASNLGWLFDGFEIYALFLTVGFALHQLLDRLIAAFAMMLSVTFGFWGVATFVPTYVGSVAGKMGLDAPFFSAIAGLLGTGFAIFGFIALGFLADGIGRKPTAMLYYFMCMVLTPVVYLWTHTLGILLVAVAVFGFFTGGIWSWAPIWLPELFPTRMRGTAVAFCFNAPRWISCVGPLIAGTLIVGLGGYGPAATIVGLFFIVGVIAAPFLPETKGKPLPHALWQEAPATAP